MTQVTEAIEAWAYDPESRYIELNGCPIFRVFGADDFPCIEDEERFEAERDYLAHAGTVVLLLNAIARGSFGTTGEAVKAYVEEQAALAMSSSAPPADAFARAGNSITPPPVTDEVERVARALIDAEADMSGDARMSDAEWAALKSLEEYEQACRLARAAIASLTRSDPDATTGCADDQTFAGVSADDLRAALKEGASREG